MTTRRQRWGAAPAVAPARIPTQADLDATVYSVIYLITESGVTATTERVLAFSEEQAKHFGSLRTRGVMPEKGVNVTVRVEPLTFADATFKASILTFETAEEWQERQHTFAERQHV